MSGTARGEIPTADPVLCVRAGLFLHRQWDGSCACSFSVLRCEKAELTLGKVDLFRFLSVIN